jgi:hypothetical protein
MIPARNVMDVHGQDFVATYSLLPILKTFAQWTRQKILAMLYMLNICVCVCVAFTFNRFHPQQSFSPLYSPPHSGGTCWGTVPQAGRSRARFLMVILQALGTTKFLTKMSARNIVWGWGVNAVGCVELTTLPPPCVDCLEIWEPQPLGSLFRSVLACTNIVSPFLYMFKYHTTCGQYMRKINRFNQ